MNGISEVIILTLVAGLAIPLGGLFAHVEHIKGKLLRGEILHGLIAFGGGALLSAIALVLIPHGIKELSILAVIIAFLFGAVIFLFCDHFIQSKRGAGAQLLAMMLDFLPESISLGAIVASGHKGGILLAFLIAIQNLPEGFNAYRELEGIHFSPKKIIVLFLGLAFLGPLIGGFGYLFLAGTPRIVSFIMVLASGGILYLIFQDIAPAAKYRGHWAPPLGAVLGFLLGVVGQMCL